MTIDEAIEIQNTARARGYTASLEGFDAASQLGIEALKGIKSWRKDYTASTILRLPGETKD